MMNNKIKEAQYGPLLVEKKTRKRKNVADTNSAVGNVNGSNAEDLIVTEAFPSIELMPDDTLIFNESEQPIRVNLKDGYQSIIPLMDDKYSIMSQVTSLLKYMSLSENFLEPDDTVELFEGSTHTKGEWSREFHSICNKFILPQDAQKELLNLIFNTFGQTADLPVALTTSGKKRFKKKYTYSDDQINGEEDESGDDKSISDPNTLSRVNDYIRKASRWIKVNQCLNSCCVFVGKLKTAFACPKCGARRYKECVRFDCKGKGKKDDCDHLHMDGVAKKTYFIGY